MTQQKNSPKIPEGRFKCAGEYCATTGFDHRASELYLNTEVMWPGFFCSDCMPAPMDLDPSEPPADPTTLEQYIEHMTTAPDELRVPPNQSSFI